MLPLLLLLVVSVFAQKSTPYMDNSRLIMQDTLYIDSTETEYSKFVWLDRGANNVLLIEGADDSTSGFASDSAIVSLTLMQGFPVSYSRVAILNSKAHQDSTDWPGSSVNKITDSLRVSSMCDTSGLFKRDSQYVEIKRNDSSYVFMDHISGSRATGYGGFTYFPLIPDWSPFVSVKVTGLTGNMKRGTGSRWVLRVYSLDGTIVKSK